MVAGIGASFRTHGILNSGVVEQGGQRGQLPPGLNVGGPIKEAHPWGPENPPLVLCWPEKDMNGSKDPARGIKRAHEGP